MYCVLSLFPHEVHYSEFVNPFHHHFTDYCTATVEIVYVRKLGLKELGTIIIYTVLIDKYISLHEDESIGL